MTVRGAVVIAAIITLFVSNPFGSAVAADPKAVPLVRTAQSGAWSDVKTWEGGKVPGAGARVQVRTGHTVTYDVASDVVIRSVHVAGTLTFARDRNTTLNVGLIKIQPGDDASEDGFDCDAHAVKPDPIKSKPALEVGTAADPIPAKFSAAIRLHHVEGLDKETCPAVICCGGRMDLHGAPLGCTWTKLATHAKRGEATVSVQGDLTGWKAGDRVILTGTFHPDGDEKTPTLAKASQTEERVVMSVRTRGDEAGTIKLDQPLNHDHYAEGEFRGEVANLSRNVVVESADPAGVRGHTMYHRHSAGRISYAEFRHLGKEGVLGKYALHFHLCRETMRGSSVVGASIWDSQNRWVTIHGTEFLVVRDCHDLASVHDMIGDWHAAAGRPADALRSLDEARGIWKRLAATNPHVAEYWMKLAGTWKQIGLLYRADNNLPEAIRAWKESAAAAEMLIELEKENHEAGYHLAVHHGNLSAAYIEAKQFDNALAATDRAVVHAETLNQNGTTNPEYRRCRAGAWLNRGLTLTQMNRPKEALPVIEKAVLLQRDIFAQPGSAVEDRKYLSGALHGLANTYRSLGRAAEAAGAAFKCEKLFPADPNELFDMAGQYARCIAVVGKGKANLSPEELAERQKYADRSVELLQRAVRSGYKNLKKIEQDRFFTPLHGRDDFQAILRRLREG